MHRTDPAGQFTPPAAAESDIKATFRRYDAALRAGGPAVVAPFWVDEYVFVNPAAYAHRRKVTSTGRGPAGRQRPASPSSRIATR